MGVRTRNSATVIDWRIRNVLLRGMCPLRTILSDNAHHPALLPPRLRRKLAPATNHGTKRSGHSKAMTIIWSSFAKLGSLPGCGLI